MPFSLYAGGATLALVLSFMAVAVLAKTPVVEVPAVLARVPVAPSKPVGCSAWGSIAAVLLLFLCIVSGFIGTADAFANINMTLFWVVFFLGVPYAVALFGDFFERINPWVALASGIERAAGDVFRGHLEYPPWLGHWPALVLYMALIANELFAHQRPFGLSVAISVYTLIMLAGAWLFGKGAWFSRAEVFGIIFRLLGKMALRARLALGRRRVDENPADLSLVLFVLFMLSSTAFDGFHATVQWVDSFWKVLYPHIRWVDALWGATSGNRYAASTAVYHVWQWLGLIASPFLYLGVFALFMELSRIASRSTLSTRTLISRFAFTLLPIAFVYNVSHYFTLLLMQAPQLVRLVSDPFGFSWNLFGSAHWRIEPVILDIDVIWHAQVALIVGGHMASVLLAHFEALRTFRSSREATLSQLPMLGLMVLFTASGLWILSLPISSGS